MSDHGHRFAVYSPSGVHIGLWNDGKIAADVAAESPGNTIDELVTFDHSAALVAEAREEALREAADQAASVRWSEEACGKTCAMCEQSILSLITKGKSE